MNKRILLFVMLTITCSGIAGYVCVLPRLYNKCQKDNVLNKVAETRSHTDVFKKIEKSMSQIATEGGSATYYYDKGDSLVLVDVTSYVSLARFFTSYYIENGEVYYINSVTDEWDLKKLYGEHADLPDVERRYVVATSTREGYVIVGGKLCAYIADRPRTASAAVTASDPEKDSKQLLEIFQEIRIED